MNASQTAAFWLFAATLFLGALPIVVGLLLHLVDWVSDRTRKIPSVKIDPWQEVRDRQRQYRREEMADWDKRFKELLPEETQMQRIHRQRRELFDLRDMLEYNNSINAQEKRPVSVPDSRGRWDKVPSGVYRRHSR